MFYLTKKGFAESKPKKVGDEIFLTVAQVHRILDAVEASGHTNSIRDHALIYLGFYLGLRCGEVVMLNRNSMRDLNRDIIHIRTLKCEPRIPCQCEKCGRRFRVAAKRIGKRFPCPNCRKRHRVQEPPGRPIRGNPPEIIPTVIESPVIEYCRKYIKALPHDQEWLFTSQFQRRMSTGMARCVFNTYASLAGIDSIYSWHALRHGRGVMLWEASKDLELVRSGLRQKSISTAQIYTHLSPASRKQYADKLVAMAKKPGDD